MGNNLPVHLLDTALHAHVACNIGLLSCMENLGEHGHAGPGSGEFADVRQFACEPLGSACNRVPNSQIVAINRTQTKREENPLMLSRTTHLAPLRRVGSNSVAP
jgi:hypothetical protein